MPDGREPRRTGRRWLQVRVKTAAQQRVAVFVAKGADVGGTRFPLPACGRSRSWSASPAARTASFQLSQLRPLTVCPATASRLSWTDAPMNHSCEDENMYGRASQVMSRNRRWLVAPPRRPAGPAVLLVLVGACFGFPRAGRAAEEATAEKEQLISLDRPGDREFIRDLAHLINEHDQQEIKQIADRLLTDKATPIIVVTINSMAEHVKFDMRIEPFAQQLFDQWALGVAKINGQDWNTGILLLVSKGDRKARIELGAGWRRDHDRDAQQIMDQIIIPQFKQGDFSGGILAGVQALDKMARGLKMPQLATGRQGAFGSHGQGTGQAAESLSPWAFLVPIALVAVVVVTIVSLVRSGTHGWGWLLWAGLFGLLGVILYTLMTNAGNSGSGGGYSGGSFGGGSSGGGGASGSW
jgi:uncharacterized protein